MTPEEVRQLIREELSSLIGSDRYKFEKHLQILDGRNIQLGRAHGTKIGTGADQKLGFFGASPVDQPATIADPSGGATIDSAARIGVGLIIDRLQELGLIA